MTEELDLLHSEIERIIGETDDWLDVTTLHDTKGWIALVKRMKVAEKIELQKLLNEKDHAEMRYVQGYLAAYADVRDAVVLSEARVKTLNEELAERQRDKDQELDQAE